MEKIDKDSQRMGSQRLLQLAIKNYPELIVKAFEEAGALPHGETIKWTSPLSDENFKEYRDDAAFKKLGLENDLTHPLKNFWPNWGLFGMPLESPVAIALFCWEPKLTYLRQHHREHKLLLNH